VVGEDLLGGLTLGQPVSAAQAGLDHDHVQGRPRRRRRLRHDQPGPEQAGDQQRQPDQGSKPAPA
jgi:hypothetical protein